MRIGFIGDNDVLILPFYHIFFLRFVSLAWFCLYVVSWSRINLQDYGGCGGERERERGDIFTNLNESVRRGGRSNAFRKTTEKDLRNRLNPFPHKMAELDNVHLLSPRFTRTAYVERPWIFSTDIVVKQTGQKGSWHTIRTSDLWCQYFDISPARHGVYQISGP